MTFPKILATSVVRGSQQGESHGGVFLIDLENNTSEQKIDWNDCTIDFEGRGADRGLRGIAYYNDQIYIAASNEIFIFDQNFKIIRSLKNPFLKHCHEICIWQGQLYLTSTGFDSLLIYNLQTEKFTDGIFINVNGGKLRIQKYDPTSETGPTQSNMLHLNSVSCDDSGLYFSGRKSPYLYILQGLKFGSAGTVPLGTHNSQPFQGGLIYNDTDNDQICHIKNGVMVSSSVPTYPQSEIINIDKYLSTTARPSFGRGLAILPDGLIIGGSSPSTIAVHDLEKGVILKTLNINMDVRNAIHGLEIWPF